MSPSISVRESIRWKPDIASEPTHTVVLTSPENRFVDIRVLRPWPPYPTADEKLPSTHEERLEDILPLTRLDWGFAGTSSSTISTSPQSGHIAHAKWSHWVDSRHMPAEKVSDQGDLFAMTNGRTLEAGAMVNPANGMMMEYEEVWIDVEIVATAKVKVSPTGGEVTGQGNGKGKERAGSGDDGNTIDATGENEKKKTCIVLVLQDDERDARGMVIQLGQFCQGILRVGESVSVERWMWHEARGWIRQTRMGDLFVPCGICTSGREKVPEVGGEVQYQDFKWTVVENVEV